MEDPNRGEGAELARGIVPDTPGVSSIQPAALKAQFQPWHKPRKQWARLNQWADQIRRLIRESQGSRADGKPTFRYLSLPGNDLFDVREIRAVCEAEDVVLQYTGFNSLQPRSADDLALSATENEIRALPNIHRSSVIHRHRLEAIAEAHSVTLEQLKSTGPYDAINLDLCGSTSLAIAPQGMGSATVLDALAKLCLVQSELGSTNWLLFITTVVDAEKIDGDNFHKFAAAILRNAEQSEEFLSMAEQLLCGGQKDLHERLSSSLEWSEDGFLRAFALGFGKWLACYLHVSVPPVVLKMLQSGFYKVARDSQLMLTLAFRCTAARSAPKDRFGVVQDAEEPSIMLDEVEIALAIARELSHLTDIDAALAADPQLAEYFKMSTIKLLEAGYYDVAKYEAWLSAAS